MKNLIKNSRWLQGSCNEPACFSLNGASYDSLCVCGCRTCSSTRGAGCSEAAIIRYDELIPVRGCCCKIKWGMTIRCADADCLMLLVESIDCRGVVISKERRDITGCVCGCFRPVMGTFCIPKRAKCVRLSLLSKGRLTAMTCFAPTACFVN